MRRPSSPTPAPFRCHDCGVRAPEVIAVILKVPRLLVTESVAYTELVAYMVCVFTTRKLLKGNGEGEKRGLLLKSLEVAMFWPN